MGRMSMPEQETVGGVASRGFAILLVAQIVGFSVGGIHRKPGRTARVSRDDRIEDKVERPCHGLEAGEE